MSNVSAISTVHDKTSFTTAKLIFFFRLPKFKPLFLRLTTSVFLSQRCTYILYHKILHFVNHIHGESGISLLTFLSMHFYK